jgi:hypothetical protein
MRLTDNEYNDFENTVYEIIYDKLTENPLIYSSPKFLQELIDDISELFVVEWRDANLISNDGDDEYIEELVTQLVNTFFVDYNNEFPERSASDTKKTTLDKTRIAKQIEHLQMLPLPAQKSKEWYEYRHGLMTASNIWKALSTDAQRNSLIYEKCKPHDAVSSFSSGTLQWGILYETVSIMIYEKMFKTKIADFGCIQHPTHKCIGASPDGINVDPDSERYGRMIEVKNIVNREITGIPKEEYWVQTQIQMETCDLDECDFIETRFKEYETVTEFNNDTEQEWRGVILRWELNASGEHRVVAPVYNHMPFDRLADVDVWIVERKNEMKANHRLSSVSYWYLDEFSCVYVPRNRRWFQAALPVLLNTWDIIVKERETGYEHRAAKKRENKPICLIKLE